MRESAKLGLLWGIGFTLTRDVIQFLSMLVLVRLLSPEIYGQQAVVQTIITLIAVVSLKTLAQYPLQARHPAHFDWDAHFTVGVLVNLAVFAVSVLIGLGLHLLGGTFSLIGLLVLVCSPVFLLEIAGTYQLSWLQAHHRWKRLRTLLLAGALLSSAIGVLLAWMGWGPFALAIMTLLLSAPLSLDLLLSKNPPRFSLSHAKRYADGLTFGANRLFSSAAYAGRGFAESTALAAFFGFSSLGSFSRAIGLAQITSGRVGPVAAQTLYSILTRAEAASDRFRKFAAMLLQGVVWLSIPSAAFVAVESQAVVSLLYGAKWESVAPLLPLAGIFMALRGVSAALNQVMLANLQISDCLKVDMASLAGGVAAIAIGIPLGVMPYLMALVACEALTLVGISWMAARGRAIAPRAFLDLAAPSLAGSAVSVLIILALPTAGGWGESWSATFLRLCVHGLAFFAAYVVVLRLVAPQSLTALLDALPLQPRVRRAIGRFLVAPAVNI
jgi:O-antigen/teichoic acid export membrane protein